MQPLFMLPVPAVFAKLHLRLSWNRHRNSEIQPASYSLSTVCNVSVLLFWPESLISTDIIVRGILSSYLVTMLYHWEAISVCYWDRVSHVIETLKRKYQTLWAIRFSWQKEDRQTSTEHHTAPYFFQLYLCIYL